MFIADDLARWGAFGLFVIAGITDFLDGYIARARNEISPLGTALDPIADKLLTAAALLLLIKAGIIIGPVVIAALIILLRELWVSGLREAMAQLGKEVSLPVTRLAKWKTAFQFLALAALLAPLTRAQDAGILLLWVAALLTLWTGAHYTRTALKYLI